MTATGLEQLIQRAHVHAQAKQQQLTVEHTLIALTEAPSLVEFWGAFNMDTAAIRTRLEAHIAQRARPIDTEQPNGHVTPEFTQLIQRALMHACAGGTGDVRVPDIFAALFDEDSFAVAILKDLGLTRVAVLDYLDPYV